MRHIIASVLLTAGLAFVSGCAHSPTGRSQVPPSTSPTTQIVEIVFGGNGIYTWKSQQLSLEKLQEALSIEGRRTPIAELHLLSGPISTSVGNLIEVAMVAKALNAKAMYEHDGELSSINFAE